MSWSRSAVSRGLAWSPGSLQGPCLPPLPDCARSAPAPRSAAGVAPGTPAPCPLASSLRKSPEQGGHTSCPPGALRQAVLVLNHVQEDSPAQKRASPSIPCHRASFPYWHSHSWGCWSHAVGLDWVLWSRQALPCSMQVPAWPLPQACTELGSPVSSLPSSACCCPY